MQQGLHGSSESGYHVLARKVIRRQSGADSSRPYSIVAAPRSGSTMIFPT
jgi:hypothetical protein